MLGFQLLLSNFDPSDLQSRDTEAGRKNLNWQPLRMTQALQPAS
jgi:hypothetical protein